MSILKELVISEAVTGSTETLLKTIAEVEAQMQKVEAEIAKLKKISSQLPSQFRQHIHAGPVHNLDTPKEYRIWVGIENVKDMYSLSKGYRESKENLAGLKQLLKDYKK